MADRGVVGFKAFMCDSGLPEFPRADDATLYEGLREAARLGLPVAVHAESEELTRAQHWANQALHQRRLRIEPVHSRVKRCRIVQDRIRLGKEGVRDLVMELCCALHNFRVRLNPWQPMV